MINVGLWRCAAVKAASFRLDRLAETHRRTGIDPRELVPPGMIRIGAPKPVNRQSVAALGRGSHAPAVCVSGSDGHADEH